MATRSVVCLVTLAPSLSPASLAEMSRHVDRVLAFIEPTAPLPADQVLDRVKFCVAADVPSYYQALNRELFSLAEAGAFVLFVTPDSAFSGDAVSRLVEAMEADPLYGFAVPRTNIGGSAPIPRAAGEPAVADAGIFAAFLADGPDRGGCVVRAAPVLLRGEVIRLFGHLEGDTPDLSDALVRLFIRANRRGYSAVVARRALFLRPEFDPVALLDEPPRVDRASDYAKALARQTESPEARYEALLWNRLRPKDERTLLIDIRNLAPGFNGTAQHILSLLGPLRECCGDEGFDPSFWVLRESAVYHGLDRSLPDSLVYDPPPDVLYDAAIRLSQPWSFSELRDQALRAGVNLYLFLDAIAWDCHYIRMPHLDGVWRATAAYADGLAFISGFTRDLFLERFRAAEAVPHAVAYCSINPADYAEPPGVPEGPDGEERGAPYILVVGNKYYHKGLEEAVRDLSTAFPEVPIKVLGETLETYPNVEHVVSGQIAGTEIRRLFQSCACLVFPSHYEGFGLPVLEALAYGKPVIARRSALLDEISDWVQPVEGIRPFSTRSGMLREVATVMADAAYWSARRGQHKAPARIFDWSSSAKALLGLVTEALGRGDLGRCRERLEFFYRIDQFDTERAGWANADQNRVILNFEIEE